MEKEEPVNNEPRNTTIKTLKGMNEINFKLLKITSKKDLNIVVIQN